MMRVPQEPMTIAQLKRYMDRRFDRLERTKANKSDLRRFATKRDLERFATRADLVKYVARAESLAVDTRRYFDVVAEGLEDKVAKIGEVGDLKSLLTFIRRCSTSTNVGSPIWNPPPICGHEDADGQPAQGSFVACTVEGDACAAP